VVEKNWDNRNFNDAQICFKTNVSEWSAQNFGNIFANKKRILVRIRGIQNSPNYANTTFLRNLEHNIINDYNNTLRLKEDHWKIRSCLNWLNESDANTNFFTYQSLIGVGVTIFLSLKITPVIG